MLRGVPKKIIKEEVNKQTNKNWGRWGEDDNQASPMEVKVLNRGVVIDKIFDKGHCVSTVRHQR